MSPIPNDSTLVTISSKSNKSISKLVLSKDKTSSLVMYGQLLQSKYILYSGKELEENMKTSQIEINEKIDEFKILDKDTKIKPTLVSMKGTNKPEQKNITESKLDNKVPTKCPLKEDKKHGFEDITGVTYMKNKNVLNKKKSVTTVSKYPSISMQITS